ncbi:MAG: exosortase/archaeosortase family protein [Chthoniobacterales bacterium]|nr:exosortase/archaeosortase family protein [Chthoniobacterales bacterium]
MNATVSAAIPVTSASRIRVDWLAVAAFALLWLEIVSRLRFEWSANPQYGYGWTVPFLAAYIFWRRWQHTPVPAKPKTTLLPAIAMLAGVALLVPVRLIQEANPDWRILSWAMAFAAIAISFGGFYLAGGLRWLRHFAFPVLFILVSVPWATQFEQLVIQGLMRAVASINVEVLNAIGISAVQMGNVIEVGSGFVGIDEACTGVRSLQATFMVSLFLGEFYSFSLLRRLVLVVSGALLAFVCNLIRTFLLVYVGAEQGSEAIKSWHDPAGLTILMACLFGLWGISMLMGGASKVTPAPTPLEQRRGFRLPRTLLFCVLGLTVVAEAGTHAWYGVHEARAAQVEPWSVAWPEQARNWKTVPIADEAQDLLRYNEGGGGSWTAGDGSDWTMYFFKWYPGRTAGLFIKNHRPDVCLPASGMQLRGGVNYKRMNVNGVSLPIRSYVFTSGATVLHVYYCYWDGSTADTDTQDQENWTAAGRLEAVRRGKRDIGTQMLELVAAGYETEEEAEKAVHEQLSHIVRRG